MNATAYMTINKSNKMNATAYMTINKSNKMNATWLLTRVTKWMPHDY